MGAKPSKSSDDRNLRSFSNDTSNFNKKRNHLRSVLRSKRKPTTVATTDNTIAIKHAEQNHSTPATCTTEHELLKKTIENDLKNNNNEENSTLSYKRSSPSSNIPYDSAKSKKSKRAKSPSIYNSHSKHLSVISTSDIGIYSNKSNLSSSCWTALSNDPLSQIEATTSAFTEITEHSTISKKSLYPVAESPAYHPTYDLPPIMTHDILNKLNTFPNKVHLILKQVYEHAQQQNDTHDWLQFYNAVNQFVATHPSCHIAIVYLSKCLVFGLGVNQDLQRGFDLLKLNPSCETFYALGCYYLDGVSNAQGVDKKTAFNCFKKSTEYDIINDSIQTTVAEAQCTLSRLLFQGDGVNQNSTEAIHYLIKSANNNNMYAQFLIGVHYERGFELEKNIEKAKDYYRKSADKGFPDAQAALGNRLIAESNYAQGIEWLEKAVQMGNSRAHVKLGILYDKGEGVPQNNDMALLHYKAAVENNNHAAQYILGLVHYFGRLGRQKNHKEAIRLIKQAAMAGLPCAQRVLGQLYQQGNIAQDTSCIRATKKNEREAIRWFKRAASGSDIIALGILGKCFELGTGVDLDLEKALGFYTKAAQADSPHVCNALIDQSRLLQRMGRHVEAFQTYTRVLTIGNPVHDKKPIQTAQTAIARYHLAREIEGVEYNPTLAYHMFQTLAEVSNDSFAHYWLGSIYDEGIPGIVQIDRQKAFQHFLIAADAGDNDATFSVAYMMSNHVIPQKGPPDAFPWYEKAAKKGHPMSMHSLGLCYYKGIGQENNIPKLDLALEWFEKASRFGVDEATAYMARIYLKLTVLNSTQQQVAQQYFIKALHCLKKAAERQDTYAQRELGKIYLTGKGVNVDYAAAVDLLEKASVKNDPEATAFLGDCYHKGVGVLKDLDVAIKHYLRAAELGYPYAYSAAAELYYEIGNMESAFDYYLLSSKEPRVSNTNVGRTAKMLVARLSLGDLPIIHTNPTIFQNLNNSKKTVSSEIAFEILSTLAIQDQFSPAFQPLGNCFLRGTGTQANLIQAAFWLRKSAEEHNDSVAYFNLAEIYSHSFGNNSFDNSVELDISLALQYLNKSAEMGYTEAQYRMGMIYLHGEFGVLKDDRTAANWFKRAAVESHAESTWILSQLAASLDQNELELQYQKKAATLGHVVAMRVLGQKYLKQLENPYLSALMQQEYLDEALKYLHMAGDANDTEALVILGKTYSHCTKTKLKFSNQQQNPPSPSRTFNSFEDIEEDEGESRFQCEEDEKNLAIECFEKASRLGDIDATVYAAEAWYEQKQYAAALELFQKAASQGNVLARFFCARYYIEGYGGSQLDPEKGFQELLICANELNCVHAYNTLGQCYENGIGTTKNDQLAYEWYLRAAETTHDAEAYYRIGILFSQEKIPTNGSHKDLEACKYFDLAVNSTPDNHGPSCYQLGLYYLKGIMDEDTFLLSPDICLSIEYFRTAADLNVPEAMLQLGTLFLNDEYSLEEQEDGLAQLQRATELGLKEAQFELGLHYHRGKEVAMYNNDDEDINEDNDEECVLVAQDFEKAYDLFCRSAAQKHPTATYYLGIYHQHGILVAPDLSIALEQYELAVELFKTNENAPDRWQAEFNLARILHSDIESRAYAYELFQAAHLHAPEEFKFLSKIMIAKYHLYGWAGVTVQAEEAAATLIRYAQEESFGYRVYLEVAQCFEKGIGVEQNLLQAFHWYGEVINKAHLVDQQEILPLMFLDEEVEEDEGTAMFKLAEFYRKGIVVEQDLRKADDLYRLAAKKGSQAAQEYLTYMLQRTNLHD